MEDIEEIKQQLRSESPLKDEYHDCKKNGYCECERPLSLFAGPNREYCFKCKKIVKS